MSVSDFTKKATERYKTASSGQSQVSPFTKAIASSVQIVEPKEVLPQKNPKLSLSIKGKGIGDVAPATDFNVSKSTPQQKTLNRESFFAPSPEGVGLRDVVREIPGNVGELAQSITREVAALFNPKTITPKSKIQQIAFGKEPFSRETIGREYAAIVGQGEKIDAKTAATIGLFAGAINFIPGGQGKRGIAESAKLLSKLDNFKLVKNELKRLGITGAESQIDKLAGIIVKEGDQKAITNILNVLSKTPKKDVAEALLKIQTKEAAKEAITTKTGVKAGTEPVVPQTRAQVAKTGDEAVVRAGDEQVTTPEVKRGVDEAIEGRRAFEDEQALKRLVEDANGEKSLDDFIANKKENFDEGLKATKTDFTAATKFDVVKVKPDDLVTTKTVSKDAVKKRAEHFTDIEDTAQVVVDSKNRVIDGHHRLQAIKDKGIEEINVIKLNKKGKQSFGDVYLRATEKAPVLPAQFSPNLVRAISEEKLVGPIKDVLQEEFRNVSEKTLALFAKRLAKLKRTGDIEGHLRTLREFSEALAAKGTPDELLKTFKASDKALSKEVLKDKRLAELGDSTIKLLTKKEKQQYVKSISEVVEDKKQAILAQREYDLLWEEIGQKIFDRYDDLQLRRALLQEQIDEMPGRKLTRFISRKEGEFLDFKTPDLAKTPSERAQIIQRNRNMMARSEKAFEGTPLSDRYDDPDVIREAIEDFQKYEKELEAIKTEMRELKPKMTAARMLRPMLEDVPVVQQKQAGDIELLGSADRVDNDYKDISGFAGGYRDLWRNFEQFFGKHYTEAKRLVLDPFDDSKGAFVKEVDGLGDEVQENIIKKFGIKIGSKEDAAIQRYGDTGLNPGERLTYDNLVEQFGREKADNIVEADAWFRKTYDRLLTEVNDARAKIYPNDPTKLIQKRSDYYRHFQELGEDFQGLYEILFDVPTGIDPHLAGISEHTKPKSRWLSFAQRRTGKATDVSAIGGFINYASSFSYAKHIDPNIGSFRYLRRKLADTAKVPGTRDINQDRIQGINNFLEYLDDFSNKLATKTNPVDRYAQKRAPGGRRFFRTLHWVNSRMKGNVIVGNFSSSVSQIFNVPQGIASAKLHSVSGLRRTMATMPGIGVKNVPMQKSTFILERYSEPLSARFKPEWVDKPLKRGSAEARGFGRWMLTVLDEVGTKFIWNSHYEKAIAENIDNPIRYADDMARKMVAGRGIGEVPIDQQSTLFQMVAPFQIEVGNAIWAMRDFVKKKDFAALAIMFTASYFMNEAAEKIRGSRVVFDPINSLIEGTQIALEELEDGNTGRAVAKFTGRQAGEILSNVPLGQTIAAAVPERLTQDALGMEKRELFGEGDPGRFGPPILVMSGLSDPLYRLLPPIGGAQIKKTIDAVVAMLKGEVETKSGKLNYEVAQTPLNIIQAVIFGKYATAEAREIFDANDDLFQRVYRQDANRDKFSLEAEQQLRKIEKNKDRESKIAALKELQEKDPKLAEKVTDILKERAAGLNSTDRLIKMLGVQNGERAKYFVEELDNMKTREEKIAFMKDMQEKKLLSENVLKQVKFLLARQAQNP